MADIQYSAHSGCRARLARTHPAPLFAACDAVRGLAPAARWLLRGDERLRKAAEAVFGTGVPAAPCRACTEGGRAALWLGPDEWLLLAPAEDAAPVAAALCAALGNLPHSLVDISHRQCALAVAGAAAAALLAGGCPLDLDACVFPVGMCTRTVLGKAEIVLWRVAGDAFRVEVARSFLPYVAQFLDDAARGANGDHT